MATFVELMGMILAIYESPFCRKPSIKFLSREYMVLEDDAEESQDGRLVQAIFDVWTGIF